MARQRKAVTDGNAARYNAKAYGEKLRTLRMKEGLSQEKVAEIVGMSQQSVGSWEMGINWPNLTDLPVLARLYNCSVGDLVPDPLDDDIIPQGYKQEKPENV